MDDNGKNCNDATDGKTSGIAHKYLGWESIVPKETNQSTDESANEDYEFFTSRDEHDVQVAGVFNVTGYIC